MKLYYAPFACSLSPHIALREVGVPFELSRVDLRAQKTSDGEDYASVNPKGYVPALRLDDGQVLSEGPAIVQYVADLAPKSKLAPPAASFERYRLQEWLNFISTELHKQFSPLFSPTLPAPQRERALKKLRRRLSFIEQQLREREYLLGADYTVADIYLFVVLRWTQTVRMNISEFTRVSALVSRVAARPAVLAALRSEGESKGMRQ